jgi:hypothetical protein
MSPLALTYSGVIYVSSDIGVDVQTRGRALLHAQVGGLLGLWWRLMANVVEASISLDFHDGNLELKSAGRWRRMAKNLHNLTID